MVIDLATQIKDEISHLITKNAELTAERDELEMRVNGLIGELGDIEGTVLSLQAERDALADDLLTCNKEREEYRELFSKSLTLAAEIVNLQP